MTSAIGAGAVDLSRVFVEPARGAGACRDCEAVPSEMEPALALTPLAERILPNAPAFLGR